jgi:hypothetical protein
MPDESAPVSPFSDMIGRAGAALAGAALLGVLSPSRGIPAEAGTQVYGGDRHHAKLALGPRFRGDDVNFDFAGMTWILFSLGWREF